MKQKRARSQQGILVSQGLRLYTCSAPARDCIPICTSPDYCTVVWLICSGRFIRTRNVHYYWHSWNWIKENWTLKFKKYFFFRTWSVQEYRIENPENLATAAFDFIFFFPHVPEFGNSIFLKILVPAVWTDDPYLKERKTISAAPLSGAPPVRNGWMTTNSKLPEKTKMAFGKHNSSTI